MKRPIHVPALLASLAALALCAAGPLHAEPDELPSVDELKHTYLVCDARAREERLSPEQTVYCALVADELKERGFGGDAEALLAWWRLATGAALDGFGPSPDVIAPQRTAQRQP